MCTVLADSSQGHLLKQRRRTWRGRCLRRLIMLTPFRGGGPRENRRVASSEKPFVIVAGSAVVPRAGIAPVHGHSHTLQRQLCLYRSTALSIIQNRFDLSQCFFLFNSLLLNFTLGCTRLASGVPVNCPARLTVHTAQTPSATICRGSFGVGEGTLRMGRERLRVPGTLAAWKLPELAQGPSPFKTLFLRPPSSRV